MYYAYVIYSPTGKKYYKGSCHDLGIRLSGHNSGNTTFTRKFRPWQLVYSEGFDSLDQARKRERYFKTAAGRRYLKIRIIHSCEKPYPDFLSNL